MSRELGGGGYLRSVDQRFLTCSGAGLQSGSLLSACSGLQVRGTYVR